MLRKCAENAEHEDGGTWQMCKKFLAALVGCGDRGKRVHGMVTQECVTLYVATVML